MKVLALVLVLAFVLIPAVSFSQEASEGQGPMMKKEMMMQKGMAGKGGMHKNPQKTEMLRNMMGKMMERSMVATSDGGVVVMFGNKLYKYDKKLKLVNETEIKIDFECMKKMMKEMKEKCPMHQKMTEQKEGEVSDKKQE